jgi:uncharacterized membrane protein YeaQ/YmgE (transglycosylase-associated protein family)
MTYNTSMGVVKDFIGLLIVAGICGFLGSQLMGARKTNIALMIILGFVGAIVGKFIYQFFHLPPLWVVHLGGSPFPVVWAVIGSVVVMGIYGMMSQHH